MKSPFAARMALLAWCAVSASAQRPAAPTAVLSLRIEDTGAPGPTPAMVFLYDAQDQPVRPPGLPFWHDHFACPGEVELRLPPGRYRYEIDRGPEYALARGAVDLSSVTRSNVVGGIARLVDLKSEGWWSGETHVHRDPAEIDLLMRAADLHVAEVVTWWNDTNPWVQSPTPTDPVQHWDGDRFADVMAGEDERNGGALLFFNRPAPLPIAGAGREFPPSLRFLRAAKTEGRTWVDVEKPFWLDFPLWLASGWVDSVGICHNHLQRGGMLDGEAWGLARDRDRYPGPLGNGYWTQDLYYHALNCGFRLPPTAGSASGVLPNPVGYNRVYAHVEGTLTYDRWWEAVRAGRVFVSNGPLLRCSANAELPGHVFQSERPLEILINGRVDSRDPIAALELVRNGQVEPLELPARIALTESGWFLVRARTVVSNTFRFASTGPWYAEIGNHPRRPVRAESARFFLDWVQQRRLGLDLTDAAEGEEVARELDQAERFWEDRLAAAERGRASVRVSLYQGFCQEGDFSANLETARAALAQARDQQSQFIAFPETFLSGYESREAVERGARALQDPELQSFIAETAAHDMVVLIGLARREGSRLYNTVLVIQRGRILGHYDKIMLTGGDRDQLGFTPGAAVPVFYAHGLRFAAIICHDTSFPHAAMAARAQGAELLFTPHYNSIAQDRVADHRRWVRNCHVGLACQLKMVVARANIVHPTRAGRAGYGDSFILNPQGEPLAEAGLFQTNLLTATLTPDLFEAPTVWANLNEVPAWLRTRLATHLTDFRPPRDETDLRTWLENMLVDHQFTLDEAATATGLTRHEVATAARRWDLIDRHPSPPLPGQPVRVLPYPGGRHPRLGFLDGAVMPQRETKVSVFTPWDPEGYVVVDVPEAIWSNLGLTYLAHTHIPTLWDDLGVVLPRREWDRHPEGRLVAERTLPNGIAFGTTVTPETDGARFELWVRNGTPDLLRDLRAQVCVLLAGASDFAAQSEANKRLRPPYAAVRSADGSRWVITGWTPLDRVWQNPPLPCLHSDPTFRDCAPGETVRARGRLWFYAGTDLEGELRRLDAAGWADDPR